jgi:hypothetical protein
LSVISNSKYTFFDSSLIYPWTIALVTASLITVLISFKKFIGNGKFTKNEAIAPLENIILFLLAFISIFILLFITQLLKIYLLLLHLFLIGKFLPNQIT